MRMYNFKLLIWHGKLKWKQNSIFSSRSTFLVFENNGHVEFRILIRSFDDLSENQF